MNTKNSKSTKIFIRREKARIRQTVTGTAEQKKLLDELQQRFQ